MLRVYSIAEFAKKSKSEHYFPKPTPKAIYHTSLNVLRIVRRHTNHKMMWVHLHWHTVTVWRAGLDAHWRRSCRKRGRRRSGAERKGRFRGNARLWRRAGAGPDAVASHAAARAGGGLQAGRRGRGRSGMGVRALPIC